jgi:hypothetical protein
MAGKTHSKWVTISYNGQLVTCSIDNLSGVGVNYETVDVTTLCDSILQRLIGHGDVSISASGPFNNTATTGAHVVVEPLNGDPTGATLVVSIGSGAAPTTGDARFTVTNMGVDNYTVAASTGGAVTASWNWTPRPGSTAAWSVIS